MMKVRNFFKQNTTITIGKMVLKKMFPAHANQNLCMSSEFEPFSSNEVINQMRVPDNIIALKANIIVPAMGLLYLALLKTFAVPSFSSSLFSMMLIL